MDFFKLNSVLQYYTIRGWLNPQMQNYGHKGRLKLYADFQVCWKWVPLTPYGSRVDCLPCNLNKWAHSQIVNKPLYEQGKNGQMYPESKSMIGLWDVVIFSLLFFYVPYFMTHNF